MNNKSNEAAFLMSAVQTLSMDSETHTNCITMFVCVKYPTNVTSTTTTNELWTTKQNKTIPNVAFTVDCCSCSWYALPAIAVRIKFITQLSRVKQFSSISWHLSQKTFSIHFVLRVHCAFEFWWFTSYDNGIYIYIPSIVS